MKVAVMFSGQGSQYANMGLSFLKRNLENIKLAEDVLKFDIFKTLENNNNELSQTKYTQTLMTLMMTTIFDEVKSLIKIDGVLGFSLGEYSALYAAGIYNLSDLLNLVNYRANLMDEASLKYPGKMVAVLNTNIEDINLVVNDLSKDNIITIANYNSLNQIVLSGSVKAIDEAVVRLTYLGVRRIIPLNVSGGFHSELMSEASVKLNKYLKTMKKAAPTLPLYLNTTAKPLNIDLLEEELTKQIKSAVHFYQTIDEMINDGYTHFIEIGPGSVLTNLVRKNKDLKVINIEKIEDLEKMEEFYVK